MKYWQGNYFGGLLGFQAPIENLPLIWPRGCIDVVTLMEQASIGDVVVCLVDEATRW